MARTPNRSVQTIALFRALLQDPLAWHYGYGLLGETGLKSGTLYPLLMRLCDQGLLESQWRESELPGRPPRHVYRLSSKGRAFARQQIAPVSRTTTGRKWAEA
jgi:DNA-binding PadR family transcriptional regulator